MGPRETYEQQAQPQSTHSYPPRETYQQAAPPQSQIPTPFGLQEQFRDRRAVPEHSSAPVLRREMEWPDHQDDRQPIGPAAAAAPQESCSYVPPPAGLSLPSEQIGAWHQEETGLAAFFDMDADERFAGEIGWEGEEEEEEEEDHRIPGLSHRKMCQTDLASQDVADAR